MRGWHACVQVRLYRLRWWFTHLEYTITVSLLLTTLLRNLLVGLFQMTHSLSRDAGI